MREEKEHLIAYLRRTYGNRSVLTPAEIEQETGVAPKQQSKLRKEGGFIPFRQTKVGGTVIYSIYAVADYLLGDDQGTVDHVQPVEDTVDPTPKITSRKRSRDNVVQDLSSLVLMRGFVSHLEAKRGELDYLIDLFKIRISAKELEAELIGASSGTKTERRPVKV